MGYYWPKIVQDSIGYAKKCETCEYHANFIHQPPEPLHRTVASWPFEAWGLDLVGPITPKSSVGHSYILAATVYFSKWAEAIPFKEAKKENEVNFIRTHIIYRYGVTPYSLVYGVKVVLPFEREIPSLRMAVQEGLTTEDNVKLRLQELEVLDKRRLEAQQALKCCQARMSKGFDKHFKPRSFQVGELVLAIRRPIITTRYTGNKFTSKWDGPYIVKEVYTNDRNKIVDRDGLKIGPINEKFLKKFYA
ncbi:uncharacterized protein E5676_scaffold306G003240 [Cucumis melo var. makuwa]|uniref:Integrase zinc-binding domain-containing protein n=1 Tax=Cucumis melo var. makuwa TaxID=1194695 RepID=A0A5D3D189_CUCMM|nr:uncharacterized protein E6C27_scaffold67G005310 [Cucumis melo var. makuwa]TYK18011.1 uncharacterized protein E5676_scaffold306G003240 [Cucumis melo var. makuwa]